MNTATSAMVMVWILVYRAQFVNPFLSLPAVELPIYHRFRRRMARVGCSTGISLLY